MSQGRSQDLIKGGGRGKKNHMYFILIFNANKKSSVPKSLDNKYLTSFAMKKQLSYRQYFKGRYRLN